MLPILIGVRIYGYTCAVVPQSRSDEMFAKREESIEAIAAEYCAIAEP
jgi:hypothetical protein